MTSKLTIASHFALAFLLLGMGAHVLGFVTDFWCVGSRDEGLPVDGVGAGYAMANMTDSDVLRVNVGLFRQKMEYENGAVAEEDSSLKLTEQQVLILAIAGANTLLSLILYIRTIHVFVGVSSFIIMSLMLLSAFYTFEHTADRRDKLQEYHSKWPTLKLSWSFICMFCGLLVNIISTVVFLTVLLLKGERKAANSSKGLGPTHVVDTDDKTPMVSVISGDQSYENVAYTNEHHNYSNIETPNSANESSSFPATVQDIDILIEDENKSDHFTENMQQNTDSKSDYTGLYNSGDRVPDEPYTDLDAVEYDKENNDYDENDSGNKINTVTESIHL